MLVCLSCGNTNRSKMKLRESESRTMSGRIYHVYDCKECNSWKAVMETDNLLGDSLALLNKNGFRVFNAHAGRYIGFNHPSLNGEIIFKLEYTDGEKVGNQKEEYEKLFENLPKKLGSYEIKHSSFINENGKYGEYLKLGIKLEFIFDPEVEIKNFINFTEIQLETYKGFHDYLVKYFNENNQEIKI